MKSAFNDHHAGSKAARIARSALRAALACALAFGSAGAFAQQQGDRRDDQGAPQRGHFSLPQQERGGRQSEQRGADDTRRAQQAQDQQEQQDARDGGRRGRMTPDERRDLRRQINEANMDLYQQRRR